MLNGFSGRVRRVVLNGRRYVVAPVTMLVSGVLAGSRGPLYYAQNEVSKSTDRWNGMPIVYGHPISNNSHVSARTPEIAGSLELGRVYNSRTENGRLTAEAWFDEDACNRVDSRIIQNLDAGRRMEVSTGLFTETRPAPPNAAHGGKAYSYTTHDYQPDHLALLIDQEGACSLRDGCGVLNASQPDWAMVVNCNGAPCAACAAKVENEEERDEDGQFAPTAKPASKDKKKGKSKDAAASKSADARERVADHADKVVKNAFEQVPRCPETGHWLPVGSGTGRGEAHRAAQAGHKDTTENRTPAALFNEWKPVKNAFCPTGTGGGQKTV